MSKKIVRRVRGLHKDKLLAINHCAGSILPISKSMVHSSSEWLVGVVLSIVGSVTTNFGMLLQKLDFMKAAEQAEVEPIGELRTAAGTKCRNWRWLVGFFFFIIGQVLNAVALSFASQSMLATLGACSLVSNMLLAPCLLGEKLQWVHMVSIVCIVAGSVTVVLSSSHAVHNFDATTLAEHYQRPSFIIFAVVIMVIIFFICTRLSLLRRGKLSEGKMYEGHCYAFLAAVFGSLSVLFSKSLSQLVKYSVTTHNQFKKPLTYVIIVMTVLCGILSVKALNEGLQSSAKALFLIPFYFVLLLLGQVGCAATYFGDFEKLSLLQMCLTFTGIFLTIVGVWVSSWHDANSDEVFRAVNAENENVSLCANEQSPKGYNDTIDDKLTQLPESVHVQSSTSPLVPKRNSPSRIRRASTKRFSLHRDAYFDSFANVAGPKSGTREFEACLPSSEKLHTLSESPAANDDASSAAEGFGTFSKDRNSRGSTTKNNKRRYSVSLLGPLGVV